jgi:hypothetical protein
MMISRGKINFRGARGVRERYDDELYGLREMIKGQAFARV